MKTRSFKARGFEQKLIKKTEAEKNDELEDAEEVTDTGTPVANEKEKQDTDDDSDYCDFEGGRPSDDASNSDIEDEQQSEVRVEETHKRDGGSDDTSDSELEELAEFVADHMRKARSKGKESGENGGAWTENFLSLNGPELEGLAVTSSLGRGRQSILNKAKAERIPQGLDSGFELELNLTEKESADKFDEMKKIIAKSAQDKLLEKSVLKPDLEKQHCLPAYNISRRAEKRERKKLRDSRAGEGWYNMKAIEMTPDLENDLKAIQMRAILDPKRFYKNNDMKKLPKFVQVGTVMDSAIDFYHARVSRKDRRQTIVDELLADADSRRHNKKKYMELQINRSRSKKKRRFHKA